MHGLSSPQPSRYHLCGLSTELIPHKTCICIVVRNSYDEDKIQEVTNLPRLHHHIYNIDLVLIHESS